MKGGEGLPVPKCKSCLSEEKDKTKLIKEKEGYFHVGECHQKYLFHKEQKRIETEKWDQLYKYIIALHGIIILPKGNITRLQALRNGEDIVNGKRVKKYKLGADYELLLNAYKLAEDSIRWCIVNKLNGSADIKAINYCMSIAIGELNAAWKNRQIKEKNEQQQEKIMNTYEDKDMSLDIDHNYRKKKKTDISSLL